MKKIIIINGSPRPNSISNTYKALVAYNKYLEKNMQLKAMN